MLCVDVHVKILNDDGGEYAGIHSSFKQLYVSKNYFEREKKCSFVIHF